MTKILFSLKHKIDILTSLIIEWRSISSKNLFLRRERKPFIKTEKGLPMLRHLQLYLSLLIKGIFIHIYTIFIQNFSYIFIHIKLRHEGSASANPPRNARKTIGFPFTPYGNHCFGQHINYDSVTDG